MISNSQIFDVDLAYSLNSVTCSRFNGYDLSLPEKPVIGTPFENDAKIRL